MTTPAAIPPRPSPPRSQWTPAGEEPCAFVYVNAYEEGFGIWATGVVKDGEFTLHSDIHTAKDSLESNKAEALLAGLGIALRFADTQRPLKLYILSAAARIAATEFLTCVPGVAVEFGVPSELDRFASATRQETEHIVRCTKDEKKSLEKAVITLDDPRHLTIATDGSIASTGRTAGLGWVIQEDGEATRCGHASLHVRRKGDILTAELLAIQHAIEAAKAVPAGSSIRIQSDSRHALGTLAFIRKNPRESVSSEERHLASKILQACTSRGINLTWEWVKGHANHEGNAGADRLAVLARRNQEFGLRDQVRRQLERKAKADIRRRVA